MENPALSSEIAPFDRVRVSAGAAEAAATGHVIAVSDSQLAVALLDKAGAVIDVASFAAGTVQLVERLRLAPGASLKWRCPDVGEVLVDEGESTVAELPAGPDGTLPLFARWRRARRNSLESGPRDFVIAELRAGDARLSVIDRDERLFRDSAALFLSPAQLRALRKRPVEAAPLPGGRWRVTLPGQPHAAPLHLLVEPHARRALSFLAIPPTVIDVIGGGVHVLALGDSQTVEIPWRRLRLTGYGRFFNFDHDHLVVGFEHRGHPLEVTAEGRAPARSISINVGWLSALKRAVRHRSTDGLWHVRLEGVATMSLGSARYGQQLVIDLKRGRVDVFTTTGIITANE